jgi:hypothetical protein
MKSGDIALTVLLCAISMLACILVFFYVFDRAVFARRELTAIGSRLAVVEAQTAENAARLDAISGDLLRLTEKSELRWSYYEGLGGMVEALLMKGNK